MYRHYAIPSDFGLFAANFQGILYDVFGFLSWFSFFGAVQPFARYKTTHHCSWSHADVALDGRCESCSECLLTDREAAHLPRQLRQASGRSDRRLNSVFFFFSFIASSVQRALQAKCIVRHVAANAMYHAFKMITDRLKSFRN